MENKSFFEFRLWKLITVIIADMVLLYIAAVIAPVCACPPGLECGPCTSGTQIILFLLVFVLTLYLVVSIIYSLVKLKNK